jgi:hypothetical protein
VLFFPFIDEHFHGFLYFLLSKFQNFIISIFQFLLCFILAFVVVRGLLFDWKNLLTVLTVLVDEVHAGGFCRRLFLGKFRQRVTHGWTQHPAIEEVFGAAFPVPESQPVSAYGLRPAAATG